eukprot:Unigene14933_Nuclearia_a/m.44828 Unigene14933_Nuclearia_a/g.44828  ORF Unigene14933_Nuclearia_a/g.44828 Unigene14933_Nuclearia_a/m.44828 type:complete len:348 (+) Unigene14933_Nuclearia_a:11-1054(+)
MAAVAAVDALEADGVVVARAVDGVVLQLAPPTGQDAGARIVLEIYRGVDPVRRLQLRGDASDGVDVRVIVPGAGRLVEALRADGDETVAALGLVGAPCVLRIFAGEAIAGAAVVASDTSDALLAALAINTAAEPRAVDDVQGDARWINMHCDQVARLAAGPAPDVVFVGDSIVNQMAFSSFYRALEAMDVRLTNLGIGGDQVQHAHWRAVNADLRAHAAASCKAAVLLVGTNNHGHTARQVAEGVAVLARVLADLLPAATVLVLEYLPRGRTFNALRIKRAQVNRLLGALLAGAERIELVETGALLVRHDADEISSELMMDYLHLSDEAYGRLARLLLPRLHRLGVF